MIILRKYFLILCLILPFWIHLIQAQEVTKAGTVMGTFLKIGVGPRAAAMGESFVATANDLTSIYWNPAGMAWLSGNQAYFSQTEWLAGMQHSFGAMSLSLGEFGTIGGSFILLKAPDQEVTTVESPDGTGEMYSYQDISFGLSYSRQISDRFSFGITGKYIVSSLYRLSATAFAFDVGTLYLIPETSLRLGMSLSNFGTKMQYTGDNLERPIDIDPTTTGETDRVTAFLKTEQWDLPLSFKVALSNDFHLGEQARLTVSIDAVNPNDNKEYLNIGGELAYKEFLFLRGGFKSINLDQSEGGLSFGAGLDFPIAEGTRSLIDYSFTDWGRLKNVHRFGIGIKF
ncbi:MAG: PorV/PorQ family protein [Bacteroidota bacterium]|nr:PorV/PorQ family protein [Bacteroidota bacterium]